MRIYQVCGEAGREKRKASRRLEVGWGDEDVASEIQEPPPQMHMFGTNRDEDERNINN
jgi:hypothetical protein